MIIQHRKQARRSVYTVTSDTIKKELCFDSLAVAVLVARYLCGDTMTDAERDAAQDAIQRAA